MRYHVIALTLALGAQAPGVAAQAGGQFSLPPGCEAYVTIQKRSCIVSHLFTCEGDAEGYQRRVDLTETGLAYLGVIDAETQWIESYSAGSDNTDMLVPDAADPASFSELIETGRDTFDFETTSNIFGLTRYVGEDSLTGRSVTIDGVELEETSFEVTAFDATGTELYSVAGNEYINGDWRTFVSGTRTVTTPEESNATDQTPVQFDFPGDAGFLASEPRHDCSVMMSALDLLP